MRIFLLKLLSGVAVVVTSHTLCAQDRQTYYSSLIGINSEPVLFNALNMNSYELLTTSIQVSKDQSLQKVVFAPFKLRENPSNFFSEIKVNLAQKDKISTFGIGWGFNTASPYSRRGVREFADLATRLIPLGTMRSKGLTEQAHEYEAYVARYERRQDSTIARHYEHLVRRSVKLTLAYNTSLFELIGGEEVDLNQDGTIDNAHRTESNAFTAGLIYAFDVRNSMSVNAHYIERRSGPETGKKVVPYIGASVAFAATIAILDADYLTTKDYLKSLFIPSVLLGASVEYQNAIDNKAEAKDGITQSLVITPFLDFKINPKAQFRIGVPIRKDERYKDDNITAFGPMLQLLLQVADNN